MAEGAPRLTVLGFSSRCSATAQQSDLRPRSPNLFKEHDKIVLRQLEGEHECGAMMRVFGNVNRKSIIVFAMKLMRRKHNRVN